MSDTPTLDHLRRVHRAGVGVPPGAEPARAPTRPPRTSWAPAFWWALASVLLLLAVLWAVGVPNGR